MKQFLIVDGPEKAGKTSLIERIKQTDIAPKITVVKWGPVYPDDRVYADHLRKIWEYPSKEQELIIFDRGWPAEHVYARLLDRHRRGRARPWLLEWLHSRATYANGVRVILLPRDPDDSIIRRDETDLPVNPRDEIAYFSEFGYRYGWTVLYNNFVDKTMFNHVDRIYHLLKHKTFEVAPQHCTMPIGGFDDLNTVFVGEDRISKSSKKIESMPGAWLPFSSKSNCMFVDRHFRTRALYAAWANASSVANGHVPGEVFEKARQIVAFGKKAEAALRTFGVLPTHIFADPTQLHWSTPRGIEFMKKFSAEIDVVMRNL